MNIRRSFEILELDTAATEAEARQAYKDIVNVWHPDRFLNNPRLREKAEKKLKEVNAAYASIKVFIRENGPSENGAQSNTNEKIKKDPDHHKNRPGEPIHPRSKTEIAAEVGTGVVLGVYSYISSRLRKILEGDGDFHENK